ncbi:hypothetical protein [Rhodoflexus sp.]
MQNKDQKRYNPDTYLTQADRDTLMVDIISRIYALPENMRGYNHQRTELPFRRYFTEQLSKFQLKFYHITPDSTHFFYVIRPARNAKGYNRGVGGRFKKCGKQLCDFEEVFVTPYMPDDSLMMRGNELFRELVKSGNVDMYLKSPLFIEWPSETSKYDKKKMEWTYRMESDTTQQ